MIRGQGLECSEINGRCVAKAPWIPLQIFLLLFFFFTVAYKNKN